MDESDAYYGDIVDGLSDVDSSSSSDDDTNCQKLLNYGKYLSTRDKAVLLGPSYSLVKDNDDDSNLSFEAEMQNEMSSHINGVHVVQSSATTPNGQTIQTEDANITTTFAADNIPSRPSTSQINEQENDQLLYDPDEDDSNERWIDSIRRKSIRLNTAMSINQCGNLSNTDKPKLATSDATLNCPCCMKLLSLDCQRHQLYKTQYRAMFVSNCLIDYNNKLVFKDKAEIRNKFKRSKHIPSVVDIGRATGDGSEAEYKAPETIYYPVHCANCNTQVAVYDHEQVYHFFSVLASH